jgi:hypothetical protein
VDVAQASNGRKPICILKNHPDLPFLKESKYARRSMRGSGGSRSFFDWDIPEIDQHAADKLILAAMHIALDDIAAQLAG